MRNTTKLFKYTLHMPGQHVAVPINIKTVRTFTDTGYWDCLYIFSSRAMNRQEVRDVRNLMKAQLEQDIGANFDHDFSYWQYFTTVGVFRCKNLFQESLADEQVRDHFDKITPAPTLAGEGKSHLRVVPWEKKQALS